MSVERRDRLLSCLRDSCLPVDLVEWLACGLEVQAAGGDMLEALELDGPDNDRRDDLLRTVIALSPGGIPHCKDCVYCGVSQGR